ncbi:acyltransferase family protein [Runella limosa]|uniref:acyltransferase family protein n=1 Tax=Runella limosa TaxID=370978 RepID=UPI00048C8983|nr:acyltransferase [Runella limosa]
MHQRLATLDTFRGVAALAVVLFHLTLHQYDAPFHLNWGATGVDLFFIISGFVIFLTLNKTQSVLDFVVARFSRLYPVYWAAVTLTALFMAIGSWLGYSQISLGEYIANMTMFQYYFGIRDLDGSYWTLIVEMLFYGVMLLGLWLNQIGRLEWYGLGLVVVQIVLHGWVRVAAPSVYEVILKGFPLMNHFQLFWAGILFYKMFTQGYDRWRLVGIAIAYGVTLYLYDKTGRSNLFLSFWEYSGTTTVYFVLFFLFVSHKLEWINNRVTLYLGTISYSLYVIHHYFTVGVITVLKDKFGWSFVQASTVALAAAFVLATAITYFIEKPSLQYLRVWYKNRKALYQTL